MIAHAGYVPITTNNVVGFYFNIKSSKVAAGPYRMWL